MQDTTNPVEALFLQALELPEADRIAFLKERCGEDDGLLQQVQELLASHERTGSFVVDRHAEWETRDVTESTEIGEQIGAYTLREKIGEGGMGVVYVAEQARPIGRKVALKVIKPGMDSKAVLARFDAEQQALAMMNHRNIAKVLDAGISSNGRPYFVMELVSGIPITEYCDEKKLNIEERLKLFIHVCRAIQHAHQKGIIHRDIKPSNVLVTEEDGQAIPKVIDFGVAKALSQKLTDRTLYTNFQAFLGTPLYASPEQASLSNVDVDTRSDVYSLGVLLYELVTGSTPYNKEELQKAAYEEMCRIIREQEAIKPSTLLSTLGQTATDVSQRRRSDPTRLVQSVRGDLDWIVMKALEKDRGRRYDGPSNLAADIEHLLKNEPINARPPTVIYRAKRYWQRNRTSITAVILATSLVLVGGIAFLQQSRSRELTLSFQQSLSREIESMVVNGSFDEARKLLDTSENQGISSKTVNKLRAQIELFDSTTYGAAVERLEKIRTESTGPDLTVDSMLCLAYQRNGQEEAHLDLLEEILERDCVSFADHLYRGYAANIFFPDRALVDLRKARSIDPTSHLAMLVEGETEQNVGELSLDPKLGLEKILSGIGGLQAVARYLPDNDIVQADLALANLNASFRFGELADPTLAQEYAERADRQFLELTLVTQEALRARAFYFLYKNDFKAIRTDFELGKRTCGIHSFQKLALAIANYRNGDFSDAHETLESTDATFAAAFMVYLHFDGFTSPDEVAAEFRKILGQRSAEASVYGVFDATIACLVRDSGLASESLTRFRRLAESTKKVVWSKWADLLCGELEDPNEMFSAVETNFDLAYSHFFAAFRALAENDRCDAKSHFQAVLQTNRFELFAYPWSEAWSDEDLWKAYIQLTEAEDAFRIQKSDLSIRPVWHQKEERVRAHIFVCFLSFVLWKTLGQQCKRAGLGDEPRRVISELSEIRLVDVVLPTDTGREIRNRCVTRPTEHQRILIDKLGFRLPTRIREDKM